jgi:hypothetical protein
MKKKYSNICTFSHIKTKVFLSHSIMKKSQSHTFCTVLSLSISSQAGKKKDNTIIQAKKIWEIKNSN